jgi:hypothetical protein
MVFAWFMVLVAGSVVLKLVDKMKMVRKVAAVVTRLLVRKVGLIQPLEAVIEATPLTT